MLVLVLEDVVWLFRLGVEALGFLAFRFTEFLQLLCAMEYSTHHDLTGHGEAGWVHLAEHDCLLLAWEDLNIIAGALLRLHDRQLVELRVVDVLLVPSLHLAVDNVYVAVAFLSHGEVLRDFRGTLFREIRRLAFCKFLLGTAGHQLPNHSILVELTLLVTEEDTRALTVAADRELGVLDVIGPVELYIHVVVTLLKMLILFPSVTVLAHLAIFVDHSPLFSLCIFDFGNDEADVGVVVVDRSIKAALISLVDAQVMVTTGCSNLEAD